jgi:5-methylcytosine-specific restriction endonuclease McrA
VSDHGTEAIASAAAAGEVDSLRRLDGDEDPVSSAEAKQVVAVQGRKPTTTARGYGWRWQRLSSAVLRRDNYICHYCGGRAATADHVIPKSRGGTDAWDNLVAACRSCNGSKQDQSQPKARVQPRPRFSRQTLT